MDLFQKLTEPVSPSLIKTFGVFGVINFPLLYILGASYLNEVPAALYLRSIGFLLCFFLALVDYWPNILNRYKNHIWLAIITYCLPFFATYMFIANGGSSAWQVKVTVAMFWAVLITNWVQSLVIMSIGIILALIVYPICSGPLPLNIDNLGGHIFNYAWVVVIASIFARRKELIQNEKQQTLQMQAGAIAHEMRTPLFSMSGIGYELREVLPTLVRTYEEKGPVSNEDRPLNKGDIQSINQLPQEIEQINRQAFSFIDIMLMNLREDFKDATIETCSINDCVEEALKHYPFFPKDRKLLHIQLDEGFEFKGNPLLIQHVLFNLFKNSIYYVKAANKGEITLKTYKANGLNILSFKDTGAGIAPEILPHIFEKFYSRTKYGTGIGLAFCKSVMKGLGGDITCTSQYGEYTEFILTFPPLEKA